MGKKGKAPALATEPEELKHLGVCVNDLIQTPLGVVATVAGLDVKEGVATSQPPGHPATHQPPSNPATTHPPASMPATHPPTHPPMRADTRAALGPTHQPRCTFASTESWLNLSALLPDCRSDPGPNPGPCLRGRYCI